MRVIGMAVCAAVSLKGLPANASHDRRGRRSSQSGSEANRLAAMRSSSSRVQPAISGGRACSRLPASMSFCSLVQRPMSGGNSLSWLSVSTSQRKEVGSAAAGTARIRLARKPIMPSCWHWPSTAGSSVNWLFEQKMMRSWCSRARSSGSAVSALPDRSRTSSVSASSKISGGNVCSPHDKLSRRLPASAPLRSCSRVFMAGAGPDGH